MGDTSIRESINPPLEETVLPGRVEGPISLAGLLEIVLLLYNTLFPAAIENTRRDRVLFSMSSRIKP